jgi:hypothetical protein
MSEFIQGRNPINVPIVTIPLAEFLIFRHMLEFIQGKNLINVPIVIVHLADYLGLRNI